MSFVLEMSLETAPGMWSNTIPIYKNYEKESHWSQIAGQSPTFLTRRSTMLNTPHSTTRAIYSRHRHCGLLQVNKPLRWDVRLYSRPYLTMCPALPERPWVHSGGASRLGKNARGLERPGFGSGLAIVPQEKVIRKWNLDQLTAGFVQGRVGREKCFWKLFHFLLPRRPPPLPPETRWGRSYKFLRKNAWEGGGGQEGG